jgi:hypothetical protein
VRSGLAGLECLGTVGCGAAGQAWNVRERCGGVRRGQAGLARQGSFGYGKDWQVGQGLVGSGWVWSCYVRQVWLG